MVLLTALIASQLVAPVLDVRNFGAKPDADSTAAIQQALDRARDAVGGAAVYFPSGVWRASQLRVYGNTELRGDGPTSVIFRLAGQKGRFISVNPGAAGSADPVQNERNIVFRKLKFKDNSETEGMSQPNHLLNLNGVSNVLVEDCEFVAFRGDGIYLGSGNLANQERHNEDVVIRRNRFDGVNRQNRNGISVIDGTRVTIAGNTFVRTTGNMPGPIDLEPNKYKFQRVRDVTIRDNTFRDCGGSGAIVADIPFSQRELVKPFENLTITGNKIIGQPKKGIIVYQVNDAGPDVPANRVVIENNEIESADSPIMLGGVGDVLVQNNRMKNSKIGVLIGYGKRERGSYNIRFLDNVLTNVGSSTEKSGGAAFVVFVVDKLTLARNTIVDALDAEGNPATLALFRGASGGGFSRDVQIQDNTMQWTRPVRGKAQLTKFASGHDPANRPTLRGNKTGE